MSSGNPGMDGDPVGRLVLRCDSRRLGERPAHDDEAARKQISAIVKRQVGMNDRLAARRRQMREELAKSACDAAYHGAIASQIALEIISGVPFPGSIMSWLEAWPTSAVGDTIEKRLASGFPAADATTSDSGPGVRVVQNGTTTYTDEMTPPLSIDYWVPAPSGTQVLVTTLQLPMITEPDLFVALFDEMLSSILWAEQTDEFGAARMVMSAPKPRSPCRFAGQRHPGLSPASIGVGWGANRRSEVGRMVRL